MSIPPLIEIPRWTLVVLNSLYEIERKLEVHGDPGHAKRNVDRIKEEFEQQSWIIEDPLGQPFKETRTDLEATIVGESTENLVVTEVIKPVIRLVNGPVSRVVQKGIVVVQSKDEVSQ
ncbi:hypothetical protein [Pseudomonas helleri]|uniref:hypothetical protein n=1 Tax=Pseudomonas helleri TaxID=1608996 RepID=UPI0021C8EA93|nr:hypothetical protein [Pseudomonas helleri]MCU1756330.1 hypothetical protein [Pseudomonas helleri]